MHQLCLMQPNRRKFNLRHSRDPWRAAQPFVATIRSLPAARELLKLTRVVKAVGMDLNSSDLSRVNRPLPCSKKGLRMSGAPHLGTDSWSLLCLHANKRFICLLESPKAESVESIYASMMEENNEPRTLCKRRAPPSG